MPRKSITKLSSLAGDPVGSATAVGLRYVTSNGLGITRRRAGKGFVYLGVDRKVIRNPKVIRRIKSLAIPPAWKDVWICPLTNGHLQAVGRDARFRKQYRYHPQYRAIRDKTKFGRMIAFGRSLPRIRERIEADLGLHGLPKRKVLATVVRLLETTCIRVGNDEYAKENNSFGLTTLRNRHVQIEGRTLRFKFRGKSGQQHDIELKDTRLSRIIRNLQDLPGYDLFEYIDDEGQPVKISSGDVNDYLREITGEEFTAKDFRTWMGTGLAALALERIGPAESKSAVKRNIVAAIKDTSSRLGNRPPACRKYYVHPVILDAYANGTLSPALESAKTTRQPHALRREELAIMDLIKRHDDELARRPKIRAA
jgi:DNA topoisomerase I